ncbi:hypothetical protein ACVMB0_001020 [Bradyrhizobium sp. USDA 4451]
MAGGRDVDGFYGIASRDGSASSRMERSEIRGAVKPIPDCASLHPGYRSQRRKEKGPVLEGPEPGLVSQTASEDIAAEREMAASRQLAQGMSCGSTWISLAKRTSFQSPGLAVKA